MWEKVVYLIQTQNITKDWQYLVSIQYLILKFHAVCLVKLGYCLSNKFSTLEDCFHFSNGSSCFGYFAKSFRTFYIWLFRLALKFIGNKIFNITLYAWHFLYEFFERCIIKAVLPSNWEILRWFAMQLIVFLLNSLFIFFIELFDGSKYKIIEFFVLKHYRCYDWLYILIVINEMIVSFLAITHGSYIIVVKYHLIQKYNKFFDVFY